MQRHRPTERWTQAYKGRKHKAAHPWLDTTCSGPVVQIPGQVAQPQAQTQQQPASPTLSALASWSTRWCIFSTRDLPKPSRVRMLPRVRGEQPLAAPSFRIMVATCVKMLIRAREPQDSSCRKLGCAATRRLPSPGGVDHMHALSSMSRTRWTTPGLDWLWRTCTGHWTLQESQEPAHLEDAPALGPDVQPLGV